MNGKEYQSEFYFDYKFFKQKDELKLFQTEDAFPRLWIERNYSKPDVEYGMYIVFPQWYNKDTSESVQGQSLRVQQRSSKHKGDEEAFDIVQFEYAPKALEMPTKNDTKIRTTLYKADSLVGAYLMGKGAVTIDPRIEDLLPLSGISRPTAKEYTNEQLWGSTGDQYRYRICDNSNHFSGVGEIRFWSIQDPSKKSVLLFASNFGFKRKIGYRIIKKNDTVKVLFNNNDLSENSELKLRVYADPSYYPCVKAKQIDFETLILNPKKSDYLLPQDRLKNKKLFVTFEPGSDDSKFYILQCIQNDTVVEASEEKVLPPQVPFCPYCHKLLPIQDKQFMKQYRKGAVSCCGVSAEEVRFEIPSKTKKPKYDKNVIYCETDWREGVLTRVLPENYLSNRHYKIAITGARRAGKSVYLSRLCEVRRSGDNRCELSAAMLSNSISKIGSVKMGTVFRYKKTTMKTENISSKHNNAKGGVNVRKTVMLEKKDWQLEVDAFQKYIIDMKSFIKPTDKAGEVQLNSVDTVKDTSLYPFIFQYKKNNVYMYDFAGEDANIETDRLELLLGQKAVPMGIFYVVPAQNEEGADLLPSAKRIAEIMSAVKKDEAPEMQAFAKNCPIAVILTKFDKVEHEFDENCHCRRSDAMKMIQEGERFEGSLLDQHIRLSSAEIESYLLDKGLMPAFVDKHDDALNKLNICFFGVSSFNHEEAIKHVATQQISGVIDHEKNHLQFACSPKRIELPFLWMMKQFGIIS